MMLVVLRDNRVLIGILRSVDQFANLVLERTIERIFADNKFADIDRGIFVVRGENVVLVGEVDSELALEAERTGAAQRVPLEQIVARQQELEEQRLARVAARGATSSRQPTGDVWSEDV